MQEPEHKTRKGDAVAIEVTHSSQSLKEGRSEYKRFILATVAEASKQGLARRVMLAGQTHSLEVAKSREDDLAAELFALLVAIKNHYEGDEQDLDVIADYVARKFGWEKDLSDESILTPQNRAAEHGCYIGHDVHGWYVADESEREADDTGNSVGFDGRPHFESEAAAADALDNQGINALKAD